MKKKLMIGIAVFLVAVIAFLTWFRTQTKSHSPEAKAVYSGNGVNMLVNYCRPVKKGRLIFGEASANALQPYGKYWRVGANEATTFQTDHDLDFGGKPVKAGKYQLYAFPGKDQWAVCLGSDWDRWGYRDAELQSEVARAEITPENNAPVQEQFLISFEQPDSSGNTAMILHWDQTLVRVPIGVVQ